MGVLRSVNGGKWVGKRWEMAIPCFIMYLKVLKALKKRVRENFFCGKYAFFEKSKRYVALIGRLYPPSIPPVGGRNIANLPWPSPS